MTARIAFVYDHLWPHTIGGAERWYAAVAEELGRESPVTLISRTFPGAAAAAPPGVEIVGLGRGGRLRFPAAVAWHLLRHGRRYAVVHVCSFPQGLAILAARAGLLPHRRTALVGDWHEVLSAADWRERRGRPAGAAGRAVQWLAARSGHAAVTFSRMHARRLGRRRHVTIVPEFAPSARAAQPAGRTDQQRDPVVLFAGRLVPQKRAHLLPPVVAELRRADPEWRGVVYGDGPERARVEAAAAALPQGVVDVPGFASEQELASAMRRARALVLPTTREGFGIVVLEAAAQGLPTVLVDEPDNAAVELVESGQAGVVCPDARPETLAAAVLDLAADPSSHRRARAWYESVREQHSPASAVEALRNLHAELRRGLRSG